jgi:chlorite dismutase
VDKRTLNHFALFTLEGHYWSLSSEERGDFYRKWLAELRAAATAVRVYQVFPTRADADFLVWSVVAAEGPEDAARFFESYARAANSQRRLVQPVLALWGFTSPSVYAQGRSAQEVDPLASQHKQYLVVYPFVKSADWYLMSRDARQGMMNEHIRIGHQYPQVKQLLLYSFGLQDQEFVVVYEADDLVQFSELVSALRGSEARRFTQRDTPIITAIHHPADESQAPWV